jgi:hypothetical protein
MQISTSLIVQAPADGDIGYLADVLAVAAAAR